MWTAHANAQIVSTLEEFDDAVRNIQAGDELVMANGVWRDVELKFIGNGTAQEKISLRAEQPGKVVISGQSKLTS